jgi:hypothetical protein
MFGKLTVILPLHHKRRLDAPMQTSWLRRPLHRLQGNGLRQSDEGFDAEQVGQRHRLLCKELVTGLHTRM